MKEELVWKLLDELIERVIDVPAISVVERLLKLRNDGIPEQTKDMLGEMAFKIRKLLDYMMLSPAFSEMFKADVMEMTILLLFWSLQRERAIEIADGRVDQDNRIARLKAEIDRLERELQVKNELSSPELEGTET